MNRAPIRDTREARSLCIHHLLRLTERVWSGLHCRLLHFLRQARFHLLYALHHPREVQVSVPAWIRGLCRSRPDLMRRKMCHPQRRLPKLKRVLRRRYRYFPSSQHKQTTSTHDMPAFARTGRRCLRTLRRAYKSKGPDRTTSTPYSTNIFHSRQSVLLWISA